MINHGRTLLLNRSGDKRPDPTYFLEEYIPEDYRSIELPDMLTRIYEKLIGADSDNAYANYVTWIILRAIHGTEYAVALTDLDQRITYLHDRDVPPFGFEILSTDHPEIAIHPSSAFYDNAIRRKLYHRWLMHAETGSFVTITDMTGEGVTQQSVAGTSGLTEPITLSAPDRLTIKLGTYPIPVGGNWEFEGVLSSSYGLPEIVADLESMGSLAEEAVLGSKTEPYPTFKKLWKEHILLQYRVAGYMLGYIYKAEEARLNG
jgi:hypothetical protein